MDNKADYRLTLLIHRSPVNTLWALLAGYDMDVNHVQIPEDATALYDWADYACACELSEDEVATLSKKAPHWVPLLKKLSRLPNMELDDMHILLAECQGVKDGYGVNLKPCYVCGSKATVLPVKSDFGSNVVYTVACSNGDCPLCEGLSATYSTAKELERAWNRESV